MSLTPINQPINRRRKSFHFHIHKHTTLDLLRFVENFFWLLNISNQNKKQKKKNRWLNCNTMQMKMHNMNHLKARTCECVCVCIQPKSTQYNNIRLVYVSYHINSIVAKQNIRLNVVRRGRRRCVFVCFFIIIIRA